eukprot:4522664-Pleurochrysis_carterae.AAC.1
MLGGGGAALVEGADWTTVSPFRTASPRLPRSLSHASKPLGAQLSACAPCAPALLVAFANRFGGRTCALHVETR